MLPFYKKYWRTAFDLAVIAFTVWLTMFVFSYLYKIATPVFLSFLIFLCIEPLAKRLNRWGMKKSIATAISMMLFILVVLSVLAGLGYIFYLQMDQLANKLPEYQKLLTRQATAIAADWQTRFKSLPPDWVSRISDAFSKVTEWGSNLAGNLLKGLVGSLKSVSTFVFNFSIALILAYFLSLEIDTWKKIGAERSPKTLKAAFDFLRENVFKGISTYLKSQGILISITFAVIFVALLILRVPNAFAISLLAGIFDILPLLGVQTLFIPWIIYLFIVGDNELALWLAGLLVVVNTTRQVLEPRITGQTVGVSAFTMLAFAMVSMSLFGVAGLILAPILMILLKALYDQGYFHRWIRLPREEFTVSPLQPQSQEPEGADPKASAAP
ncbi:AI-2E family transporter [Cohnella sp. CFH 77786]|uniref:AI-2E family transporter n=1 Tax=Cohnella sp. CFH 77786 TaxID=2662265 RepID=UPI001C608E2C|nr:AI-2E family transporter [Cohnella sp. CFH 77786]MBW5444983.1 AI-2E family transporter [Cohnella sp. CFH 77786]